MTTLKTFLLNNEEKLNMYTTAISKVHVGNHPEVHEVKALYEEILAEVKQEADATALTQAFDRLAAVTDHYEIPGDTCETFAAVYQDLENADKLYRAEVVE